MKSLEFNANRDSAIPEFENDPNIRKWDIFTLYPISNTSCVSKKYVPNASSGVLWICPYATNDNELNNDQNK